MPVIDRCPGSANLKTPTLAIKKCPECGHEVEMFSIDTNAKCEHCGFIIYNDVSGCIKWCKHARECIGDEEYDRLVDKERA